MYRLMAHYGLLLQRYTGKPPGCAHDGQIITIRPNLRWMSDGFEIPCWDGQVVRVAFALDTCDREVMAWCASTRGVGGEMIRDLMLEAVEKRLGVAVTPQPIQWLSDDGSAYRALRDSWVRRLLGLGSVLYSGSQSASLARPRRS
jgi:putative transposase